MKFILFNINDTNKNKINKIMITDNMYINEISLSKTKLEQINRENKNLLNKITSKFLDKDVENKIIKSLDGCNKKWRYILSKDVKYNKYIEAKSKKISGCRLILSNEIDANIFKHIDDYLEVNKTLKKHELKVLLVVKHNSNVNFTLINNLIKEYKNVNIYLKETPTAYTLKKIKQINKEEGTTIDVIRKDKKAITDYNVIYFVDDVKESYPRFRINRQACIIDISLKDKDKYNTNLIFLNDFILKDIAKKDNITSLLSQYNNLEIANAIMKTTNFLDK